MGGIRQLANQTIWYGLSNILGRFISYLLTPLLTYTFDSEKFGEISIIFATAAFLNVIFTFGMETAYFRFTQIQPEKNVFNTSFTSILIGSLVLSALLISASQPFASFLSMDKHQDLVVLMICIVAVDALCVIPFSRLRQEGRSAKFALLKLINILINVGLLLFVLKLAKPAYASGEKNWMSSLYDPQIGIGYVFITQLTANVLTFLMLFREWKNFSVRLDRELFSKLLGYSAPLIVVGMGGMINETFDRIMIVQFFNGTVQEAKMANGIYSANYKLAILITIFVQTFRMGAEPFFFRNAGKEDSRITNARIMNFFVIACCICFLAVTLFLDVWKYFMGISNDPSYAEGLSVVPILMMANVFLGIYYNLSIWYKLTDKNRWGAAITLIGVVITLLINYLFIPSLGYMACALATLACYGTMMLISYAMGQKHYPIPYNWKKAIAYLGLVSSLFLLHNYFRNSGMQTMLLNGLGLLFSLTFLLYVIRLEKNELLRIPFLRKIYR